MLIAKASGAEAAMLVQVVRAKALKSDKKRLCLQALAITGIKAINTSSWGALRYCFPWTCYVRADAGMARYQTYVAMLVRACIHGLACWILCSKAACGVRMRRVLEKGIDRAL